MRQKAKMVLTFALSVCIPCLSAAGDIYQYTDQNGVIHLTNLNSGGRTRQGVKEASGHHKTGIRKSAVRTSSPVPRTSTKGIPSAYIDIINTACDRHGVDPSLVHALVKVESDFNPYAMSQKGAMGLMQLMPQTALDMNVKNTFNPVDNVDAGVKYLRYLIDRYEGNVSLALAAYNSGETAVRRWGTIPPFKETQDYVRRIMKIYNGGKPAFDNNRYTIYMGYTEDGSILLTDNPSASQCKTLKPGKKKNL